jgi:hypothetical protein
MGRRKAMDVLFYALQCAKSDRYAFADAVDNDNAKYAEAMADIKAFTALQVKIFGTANSELDTATNKMKLISVKDMMDLFETDPDLFVHAIGCECKQCTA